MKVHRAKLGQEGRLYTGPAAWFVRGYRMAYSAVAICGIVAVALYQNWRDDRRAQPKKP